MFGYEYSGDNLTGDDVFRRYGFDPNGNNELGTMFKRYGAAMYPGAMRGIDFANFLQPMREDAVMGLLGQMTPEAVEADIQNFSRGATENAAKTSQQAAMHAKASGMGDGFTAGQQAGAFGKAASESNAYRAVQESPQARMQRFNAILNAIDGGSQNQMLGQQMSLFGPIEQRHQQNRSEMGSGSALGAIMQAAGMAGGMGAFDSLGSLFGGNRAQPMVLNQGGWYS